MTLTTQKLSQYETKTSPYYQTFGWQRNVKNCIVTPYLPMTQTQAKQIEEQRAQQAEDAKAKRFHHYQELLLKAKQAGIPTYEIENCYQNGQDLSGIKIRNNSLIITNYNLGKRKMFDGKEFDCVKSERTITYPKEKRTVTLRNKFQGEYEGVQTSTETISYYTTDKRGKIYKCHEVKYIGIEDEPNLSEVSYYNSDGTKSNESRKAWQMK